MKTNSVWMDLDPVMSRLPHPPASGQYRANRLTRQGLLLILLSLAIVTVYQPYHRQPHYELRVFQSAIGWGYTVLNNGTPVIHQPTVPGRSGSGGFEDEVQARRVGARVIEKLQQGQTLPTISADELRQLGIPSTKIF